ncbi:hypothetical protein [Candidatus Phytoplasma sp. AldY-WA1]|nr:hypothetical protein [Candidatus Phytoplasma sp. AldY-WA1]
MNNNNFFKIFLTILVVVVGVTIAGIIIQRKTLKNNHDKPTINTLKM